MVGELLGKFSALMAATKFDLGVSPAHQSERHLRYALRLQKGERAKQ